MFCKQDSTEIPHSFEKYPNIAWINKKDCQRNPEYFSQRTTNIVCGWCRQKKYRALRSFFDHTLHGLITKSTAESFFHSFLVVCGSKSFRGAPA